MTEPRVVPAARLQFKRGPTFRNTGLVRICACGVGSVGLL
jgi:hypothetical protein